MLVGVIMGSKSDWDTMRHASETLEQFGVAHETKIVSAHRTPQWMAEYASTAESRGLEVIIAAAGGAAHLPGMVAANTLLPVLGVPIESHALKGMDSLLSIAQMPGGIPVGTLAIGKAGAINAALLAVAILANSRPDLREKTPGLSFRSGRPASSRIPFNSWEFLIRVYPRASAANLVFHDPHPPWLRRRRPRAAANSAACSPSPRDAWATASTLFRRTLIRPPAKWPTWK
jgi:5-(carboxyamino)imidazole ribonucleotide mutase